MVPTSVILMEHGRNMILIRDKDESIEKNGSTDTMMGAMSIRMSLSLYMLKVKF